MNTKYQTLEKTYKKATSDAQQVMHILKDKHKRKDERYATPFIHKQFNDLTEEYYALLEKIHKRHMEIANECALKLKAIEELLKD